MSKPGFLQRRIKALAMIILVAVLLLAGNVLGLFLRDAGNAACRAGQHSRGLRTLAFASYVAPLNGRVWESRCAAYDGEKYRDEILAAIRTCRVAVALGPEEGSLSQEELAFEYVAARNYGAAAAALAPLAESNQDSASLAFINRPYVVTLLLARDYQAAIPAAQHMLEIEKGEPEATRSSDESLLGMAYEGTGNFDLARKAFGRNRTCQIVSFTRGNLSTSCYAL